MSVTVVTGFVPLPCLHRTTADYHRLGSQLLACCKNAVCFEQRLEDCWLTQQIGQQVAPGGKDTAAYHCVQHEKTAWIVAASRAMPSQTLVWMDYGMLHNKSITPEHVASFLEAVERKPPAVITSPSCGLFNVPDEVVNWTFCGTVLVVPSYDAAWLHAECVAERRGKPLTWEVNTWTAVRNRHPGRFRLYAANHDQTLLTGYGA